jgi:uncharacterized protein YeaO (DUF488 family)
MAIRLKRAYEEPSRSDGARVLVDRLWPRGISKDAAKLKLWLKDIAPSNDLRHWYHEHPAQWPAFQKRYIEELGQPEASAALEQLQELVNASRTVTLVYASRLELNNATVLQQLLEGRPKPPKSTGPAKAEAGAKRARARVPR